MARSAAAIRAFAAVLFLVAPAGANTIIYDNGTPDAINAITSDFDNPVAPEAADDLVLLDGQNVVGDVHWWGVYAVTGSAPAEDDFTIRFFADAGGMPAATPLHEFDVGAVDRTFTGFSIAGFLAYEYEVQIPATSLAAGTTFWLSIVNDTFADGDDDWFWATSVQGGNAHRRDVNFPTWAPLGGVGAELAFNLTGVPEPGPLLLLGTGLLGLAAARRRLGA